MANFLLQEKARWQTTEAGAFLFWIILLTVLTATATENKLIKGDWFAFRRLSVPLSRCIYSYRLQLRFDVFS